MKPNQATEPVRQVLVIAILGALVALSIWICKPFLPALIWAMMVAVATWPTMLAVQGRLWKQRWLAVLVMTLALLLVFVIPLSLAIGTLVVHTDDIIGWVKSFDAHALETPPEWVAQIPVVGAKLDQTWRELATNADLGRRVTPYVGNAASWLLGQLGEFGAMIFQFLLTLVMTAILYAKGETAADAVVRFAGRVGGARGEGAVVLAGQAIRGVALGVVVTALAQSVLGGVGLALAGIPYPALLTAGMFLLAIAQIGAAPVLFCAVLWLFWKGDTGWAIAMLVWTVIVGTMDNVLRPILIRKGADLPLLLIFVGVIGGLIAFGMVGLFVGPIVLAVSHTLIAAWIDEGRAAEEPAPRAEGGA